MEPMTVEVGRRIAGRYRLDERLVDRDSVQTWRAYDEVLARPVGIHVIPAHHPRAQAVVSAAQAAARGFDERFLRVLDAAEETELVYVIQEWITGRDLRTILAQDGPLDPAQAQAVITDVAEAIADAHLAGLAHLTLSPENVIFGKGGEVKIAGLAVEAALHGVSSADPAATDARALGALLYAALTARWPGGPAHGLAGVARDDGKLPTPRQVRAGVPAPLDEVADRALNDSPRHHLVALTSPAAFVSALRALPKPPRRPPPTIGPTSRRRNDTASQPRYDEPELEPGWEPSRGMRAVRAVVIAVVLGALIMLGVLVAMTAINRETQGGNGGTGSPNQSTSAGPLTVAQAVDYDPEEGCGTCNGEENHDDVGKLIDSDPDTTWSTFYYNDAVLPGYKPGIGFVLDLGSDQQVRSVTVTLDGQDAIAELRAAPQGAQVIPSSPAGFETVVPAGPRAGEFTLTAGQPFTTRYVLVWFTKLPPDPKGDPRFRAVIGNVQVHG